MATWFYSIILVWHHSEHSQKERGKGRGSSEAGKIGPVEIPSGDSLHCSRNLGAGTGTSHSSWGQTSFCWISWSCCFLAPRVSQGWCSWETQVLTTVPLIQEAQLSTGLPLLSYFRSDNVWWVPTGVRQIPATLKDAFYLNCLSWLGTDSIHQEVQPNIKSSLQPPFYNEPLSHIGWTDILQDTIQWKYRRWIHFFFYLCLNKPPPPLPQSLWLQARYISMCMKTYPSLTHNIKKENYLKWARSSSGTSSNSLESNPHPIASPGDDKVSNSYKNFKCPCCCLLGTMQRETGPWLLQNLFHTSRTSVR